MSMKGNTMRKRLREDEEEHANHEAWVIPYADMLTLLMGLFVVLWSMSTVDVKKLEALSNSLARSFGSSPPNAVDLGGASGVLDGGPGPDISAARVTDPTQVEQAFQALDREHAAAVAKQAASDELDRIEDRISAVAERLGIAQSVGLYREERGLVVTVVTDDVLFAPGSAALEPRGRSVLDALAPTLADLPNSIAIEGHTDDQPISNDRFPSNWELSSHRATSVLRYLVDAYHFDPKRLSASGYGEQRPIGDNTTAAGRAANRRVELVVLSTLAEPQAAADG